MPAQTKVTVTLPHVSGLPRHSVVNQWIFRTTDVGWDDFDTALVLDEIFNWWNVPLDGNAASPSDFIGDGISRAVNGVVLRFYDITGHLDGTPHGSPFAMRSFTLGDSGSGNETMPESVAVCHTLRGEGWQEQPVESPDGADANTTVDRWRARFTNRQMLGPWVPPAVTIVNGIARVNPILRAYIGGASARMRESLAIHPVDWCTWSETSAFVVPVEHVQIDDVFDTMQSRDPDPTVRETYPPL